MAKFNEILVGRFNRFLQRFLSMKGGPPAAQLATEITPQIEMDSAENLENRFPMGWRSWSGFLNSPASVGNNSSGRMNNPQGSNTLVVIEKISFGCTLTDTPQVTKGPINGGNLAGTVSGSNRDARMGASGSVVLLSQAGQVGVVGTVIWLGQVPGKASIDVILYQNEEIVLMPGDVLTCFSGVVNQAIFFSFQWRERALEEGELT